MTSKFEMNPPRQSLPVGGRTAVPLGNSKCRLLLLWLNFHMAGVGALSHRFHLPAFVYPSESGGYLMCTKWEPLLGEVVEREGVVDFFVESRQQITERQHCGHCACLLGFILAWQPIAGQPEIKVSHCLAGWEPAAPVGLMMVHQPAGFIPHVSLVKTEGISRCVQCILNTQSPAMLHVNELLIFVMVSWKVILQILTANWYHSQSEAGTSLGCPLCKAHIHYYFISVCFFNLPKNADCSFYTLTPTKQG